MDEMQTALLKMLIDVDAKLRSENVFYFIGSGTALGAVRHKGFIPWDNDADIYVVRRDLKKFIKAINDMDGYEIQEPYSIDWPRTFYRVRMNGTTAIQPCWMKTRMHQGIFIDVFIQEDYPDSPTARLLYDFITKIMLKTHDKAAKLRKNPTNRDIYFNGMVIISKILNFTLDAITGKNCTYVTQRTAWKKNNTYCKEHIKETIYVDFETTKLPIPIGYDFILRQKYGNYMQLPPEKDRKGGNIPYVSSTIDYKDYLSKILKK